MAYPDKKDRELKCVLKDTFRHFAMVLVEIISFPRKIRLHNYTNYIEVKGLEFIDEGLKNGKGVMLIAAHFGNWELAGPILGMFKYPLSAVARFLPNELVDKLLNYSRKYHGEKVIYKDNALKDMMRVLKNNGVLAIVSDQDARSAGIFVDFMGVKSSTTRSPALLHIRFGTPLIMLNCYRSRKDRFYYTLSFEPCPKPVENDTEHITQALTYQIEKAIKEHPEQWMWFHRRWKTRPQEKEEHE